MVDIPIHIQEVSIYAGLATTAITAIGVPLVGYWIAKQTAKNAAAAAAALLVAAKVDEVKRTLEIGSQRRDMQINEVVAKVEAVYVAIETVANGGGIAAKLGALATTVEEVKKTGLETHALSNGAMGEALEAGLEAAQGRYDAKPTPENRAKLDAARKKFESHRAKERTVEAKRKG